MMFILFSFFHISAFIQKSNIHSKITFIQIYCVHLLAIAVSVKLDMFINIILSHSWKKELISIEMGADLSKGQQWPYLPLNKIQW